MQLPLGARGARRPARGETKILCIATETAASLLTFNTFLDGVSPRLAAMSDETMIRATLQDEIEIILSDLSKTFDSLCLAAK